jgi:hypothetical protein
VTARLSAAGLVAAALVLDAAGAHGLAVLAVVVAVPTSGIAALHALDDAICQPGISRYVLLALATLAMALVLVAAAVRSLLTPAVELPAAGVTALVCSLIAFVLQGLVAGASMALRRPGRRLVTLSH